MIEKKIHYIWLGDKEVPEQYQGFIRGWHELHPNWEIIKWNTENFDCNSNPWVKAAIEQKNWSLAADVIRSFALLNYGGVYLDTDIELLKPLDKLAEENDFFIGYESDFWFGSAVLGVKKGHRLIKEVHDRYSQPFIKIKASTNMSTVLNYTASVKRLYKPKLNGKTIKLQDSVHLFSTEYFYPKNYITHSINITENTIALHHLNSNWHSTGKRIGRKIAKGVWIILGKRIFGLFERIARINMLGKLNIEYRKYKKYRNS